MSTHQLSDYYRLEACHKHGCDDQVVFRSITNFAFDGSQPRDNITYDSSGCIRSVVLWGKNLPTLKKTAEYLLCHENEPVERNNMRHREPTLMPQFSAA